MTRHARGSRRRFLALGLASAASLAGCESDRGFTLLGYDFGASHLYDSSIASVYVPLAYNRAFQTGPYRGMETQITKAVVREIGAKTPFKIISDPQRADTELLITLIDINKAILNRDQQNEVREGDIVVSVDVVWRDLRTGRPLSNPRKKGGEPVPPPGTPGSDFPQFDPDVPPPPPVSEAEVATPIRLVGRGRYIQELGETNLSAEQKAVNMLAVQIVSMMEKPW